MTQLLTKQTKMARTVKIPIDRHTPRCRRWIVLIHPYKVRLFTIDKYFSGVSGGNFRSGRICSILRFLLEETAILVEKPDHKSPKTLNLCQSKIEHKFPFRLALLENVTSFRKLCFSLNVLRAKRIFRKCFFVVENNLHFSEYL